MNIDRSTYGAPGRRSPLTWGGATLTPHSVPEALAGIAHAARARAPRAVHLCNAYTLTLATHDDALAEVLRSPRAVNLLDGVPVTWVLRLSGHRDPGHSRGPTLFSAGLREFAGLRQVLLGGSPETARAIDARLLREGLSVRTTVISPAYEPLSPSVLEEYTHRLAALSPDVVWVGLGTPKQDHVVEHLAQTLSVPCVAVGAAFDFYAGTVQEAPPFLRDTGLEWVYRLAAEPRRLWRRYLIGNAAFLRASMPEVVAARRRRTPEHAGV